jgi:hypothetical protein
MRKRKKRTLGIYSRCNKRFLAYISNCPYSGVDLLFNVRLENLWD